MSSFVAFIKKIEDAQKHSQEQYSVTQITIKNFEQLAVSHTPENLYQIGAVIAQSINASMRDKIIGTIYEYDKHYYYLMKEITKAKLHELSMYVRGELMSKINNDIFLDVRISATVVSSLGSLRDSMMLLSGDNYYFDQRSIFHFIDSYDIASKTLEEYKLLQELKYALDSKLACFAFQPVVTCGTGEIAYHECLLRLNNLKSNMYSVGRYILLAEKYGYITNVDQYVFEMATRELKAYDSLRLSVNISSIAIQDPMISEHILGLISASKAGSRMIIEITETAFNDNFESTKYFVDSAKSMGCMIALDDFGVGYTSFNHIRDYAIDIIKIDGCFIRGLDENCKNRALVEMLIKTSEELGCKTVAEFVESESIANQLVEMNVDYMQGNFFSPALNYRSWNKK